MSLLDVYDNLYGGGSSSPSSSFKLPKLVTQPQPIGGDQSAPGPAPAANSQERGAPERLDINNFVDQAATGLGGYKKGSAQELGLQGIELVGKAPGFIAERPLALADTLVSQATGGNFDVQDAIGQIPILGQLIGGAGDVLHNISSIPAGIANSGEAQSLLTGTQQGWADNQMVQTGLGKQMTWAQFKDEARQKGWTGQDIQDMIAGKKGTHDFADKAMSNDALTETALRFGSDPTNLLFGAGAVLKGAKGIGLLAKMASSGAELAKPLGIAQAAADVAKGIGASSTWLGLANYAGQVGRGAGTAFSIYKKAGYAITAGELGIKGAESVLGPQNPLSGFLEPLFSLNQQALDNQPLSQNQAFALFTAFHFNGFHYFGLAKQQLGALNGFLRGSGVRAEVVKALGEGWNGTPKQVIDRLGGHDVLDNLIVHATQRIEFAKVMDNAALKDSLSGYDSLSEAALANKTVGDIVRTRVTDRFKNNSVKPEEVVAALKDWHGNRDLFSGKEAPGLAFPWHGQHAIDRWVEYSAAAAPIAQVFEQRASAVVGLADTVVKGDLINMADALKVASNKTGAVPINDVRAWLSRYPQLIKSSRVTWEKYLGTEFDGKTVPLKSIQGKMRKAINAAPDPREVTHESAVAEAAAAKPDLMSRDLAGPTGELAQAYNDGSLTVGVSRMRPELATHLGLDSRNTGDVMRSRSDPTISSFENNVGQALTDSGFPVDNVSQAIGSWEGSMEPSVEIQMSKATIEEARLAAATLGKVGQQDSVALSVSGSAMVSRGLKANGYEFAFHLPTLKRVVLDAAAKAVAKEFIGFTVNDTTGVIRILMQDKYAPADIHVKLDAVKAEIESLLPKDLIGDAGLRSSAHPAYVEFVGKTKESSDVSYTQVLRDARAGADPRVDAHRSVAKAVTDARRASADAGAGLGSEQAVGRNAGPDLGSHGDITLPTADRVGFGRVEDAAAIQRGDPSLLHLQRDYLYHVTDQQAAREIAGDKLRPHGAEYRGEQMAWPDGGLGKRTYFNSDPAHVAPFQTDQPSALLRVDRSRAGASLKNERGTGDSYVNRPIAAHDLQVFGGDGQWHPLDKFFEPPVPPELVPHVDAVKAVYDKAVAADPFFDAREQIAGSLANYGGLGKWWGTSEEAGAYATDGSIRIKARFHGGTGLKEATGSSGSIPRPDEIVHVTGVEEMVGGKWVTHPTPPDLFAPISGDPHSGLPGAGKPVPGNPAEFTGPEMYRVVEGTPELAMPDRPGASPSFNPTPDPLTMGLRAREDTAAAADKGVPTDEAGLRAELVRLTQETALSPESTAAAQDVQRRLEAAILAKGEIKNGNVLYAAARDAEASSMFPLHHSLRDLPSADRAELAALDAKLRTDYGMYQLKAPPKLALFFQEHQGQLAADYLLERTKLGEVLAGKGPLSPVSHFLHWLTSPVRNDQLAKDANQALINQYMPHGATPKDIGRFVDALRHHAEIDTFAGLRLFGGITSLTQQGINRIAGEIFPAKVIQSVGHDNFAKLLDQSSNRFIRTTDARIRAGTATTLEAGLNRFYKMNQGHFPGDATRVATKTMYHIFRFMADIRWHAMNMFEADIIGGTKYGLETTRLKGAGKAPIGDAAIIHEGATPKEADPNANGWLYARHNANRVSRAFDAKRPASTLETLNTLSQTDPALVELQAKFGPEPGGIVQGIDHMLYNFDKKGVAKTITEEAQSHLSAEEARTLAPFLDQVFKRNDELFQSIKQTFNGNPNRTNLERIGNSYWLYWPLSYQLKATKWLISSMTHEFGGMPTNLAPAAVYAHYYEEHKKRLANNPEYARMFEEAPTLWYAASMIFPITPGDMGVSLSRVPRYVGGAMGLWGTYKAMDNPGSFASAVASMGPTYTGQLLERAGSDFSNVIGQSEANLYPTLPAPASNTRIRSPRQTSIGLGG